MFYEFLRPRENICKWFNELWVTRWRVYIVRRKIAQFSHKNNRVNRLTKWVNRFRQQKDNLKLHQGWNDSLFMWINSSESIQMNRFKACQIVLWDVSNKKVDSYVIRFREFWMDSSIVRNFDESIQYIVNRFNMLKDE